MSSLLSWYQHNLPLIVYDCNQFAENGEVCWHSICALTDFCPSFFCFSVLFLSSFLQCISFRGASSSKISIYTHPSVYTSLPTGVYRRSTSEQASHRGHLLAAGRSKTMTRASWCACWCHWWWIVLFISTILILIFTLSSLQHLWRYCLVQLPVVHVPTVRTSNLCTSTSFILTTWPSVRSPMDNL